MGGGIARKCAVSGARLPRVQNPTLSFQLHEAEHAIFLFLTFLNLKMETIIVLASWALIKLVAPSPALHCREAQPQSGEETHPKSHNEAEFGQNPGHSRPASQRPHTTACSVARLVLSTHEERYKLVWLGHRQFSVSRCSWRKAEKEFSFSLRRSYFLFYFFFLCTLSSWLSLALSPLSPSIFSLFSSLR